jgi:hypothetical protein
MPQQSQSAADLGKDLRGSERLRAKRYVAAITTAGRILRCYENARNYSTVIRTALIGQIGR